MNDISAACVVLVYLTTPPPRGFSMCCFGLLNYASSTKFFLFIYLCVIWRVYCPDLRLYAVHTSKLTNIPKLSVVLTACVGVSLIRYHSPNVWYTVKVLSLATFGPLYNMSFLCWCIRNSTLCVNRQIARLYQGYCIIVRRIILRRKSEISCLKKKPPAYKRFLQNNYKWD